MRLRCEIETVAAVARVLPHNAPAGAPYSLAFTVVGDDGVATLKGFVGQVDTATRRVIFDALRQAGFRAVRWTRRSADGEHRREIVVQL